MRILLLGFCFSKFLVVNQWLPKLLVNNKLFKCSTSLDYDQYDYDWLTVKPKTESPEIVTKAPDDDDVFVHDLFLLTAPFSELWIN